MTADSSMFALANEKLYNALLQNELTTLAFSEAVFCLMEAIERKGEQKGYSSKQLAEAYHYANSILAFVIENQKMLEYKKRLAKAELDFSDHAKAMRNAKQNHMPFS